MKLIVEGDPQDIQFVLSICREKVRRGQLTLTPAADVAIASDVKYVVEGDTKEIPASADTKDAPVADTKESAPAPKSNKRSKKSE